MTCDLCGKEQATVHLTEIIDNKVTELHLCEGCAREKGAQMEQHFGLADLLSGLADFGKPSEAGGRTTVGKALTCTSCGMSYSDFRKIGRFGCSHCYEVFREQVTPLLKRIHGTPYHTGKQPGVPSGAPERPATKPAARPKSELRQLKERLQRAIQHEEFEEAARLRDKIRELERKKS